MRHGFTLIFRTCYCGASAQRKVIGKLGGVGPDVRELERLAGL
jgi:hypothetical protein